MICYCNASIFGKHAAGKTILVLREVPACSAQALSEVVPQVVCDLALATQKLHVVMSLNMLQLPLMVRGASMPSNPVHNISPNR